VLATERQHTVVAKDEVHGRPKELKVRIEERKKNKITEKPYKSKSGYIITREHYDAKNMKQDGILQHKHRTQSILQHKHKTINSATHPQKGIVLGTGQEYLQGLLGVAVEVLKGLTRHAGSEIHFSYLHEKNRHFHRNK
jgi:hypothetical protein